MTIRKECRQTYSSNILRITFLKPFVIHTDLTILCKWDRPKRLIASQPLDYSAGFSQVKGYNWISAMQVRILSDQSDPQKPCKTVCIERRMTI